MGSVALDSRQGDWGEVHEELGGSAVYFALAASLLVPVQMVAPVGEDGLEALHRALTGRDIDLGGVSILDAPTYRWKARQVDGINHELGADNTIYEQWHPELPREFKGWAFVGSMPSPLQLEAARRLSGASLLAGDSMRSYLHGTPAEATDFLHACSWFFSNEEELLAMGGDLDHPERFRALHGLDGICVKRGRLGVTVCSSPGCESLPALSGRPALDTTGAGDALAGGFLARWMSTGGRQASMLEAMTYGLACASLAIEQVGTRAIAAATRNELEARVKEVGRGA